jgi:hypothetical protein
MTEVLKGLMKGTDIMKAERGIDPEVHPAVGIEIVESQEDL